MVGTWRDDGREPRNRHLILRHGDASSHLPASPHHSHGLREARALGIGEDVIESPKHILAVALGGGAARGWAHIGVLRALKSAGLHPDLVVGTSIGAIVGGHFAGGQLDALEDFANSLTRRRFVTYLDPSVSGSGLIAGQSLFDRFNKHLNNPMIEDLDTRFVAVATELNSGHETWLDSGPLLDAVRASSAIPGIVRPVRIDGRWLVDGSLVNPIPVSVCRALGARVIVAVNLNSDGYGNGGNARQIESDTLGQPPIEIRASQRWNSRTAFDLVHKRIFGQREEQAPGIVSVVFDSFSIVHDRMARSRLMGDPPDVLISPDLAGIGSFDVHRSTELVALGEAAAQEQLAAIQRRVKAALRETSEPPLDRFVSSDGAAVHC